ncbi:unnamed protein product [Musa textilis]
MAARIRLQLALDHHLSPSSRFGAYLRPSSPHLILRTEALGVVGEASSHIIKIARKDI